MEGCAFWKTKLEAGDWELEARGRGLEGGDIQKDRQTDRKTER